MIAIIDYGAGNTASVSNALKRLNVEFILTSDGSKIINSEKVILPGVGEAGYAMKQLQDVRLDQCIKNLTQPLLGICLGMQLLTKYSSEGNSDCLDIFECTAQKFDNSLSPVPHMGWNKVQIVQQSKLFNSINDSEYFYFAHSYYVPASCYSSSLCSNVISFTSSFEKDNFYGVQFHPEKSGTAGLQLIKNFIDLC